MTRCLDRGDDVNERGDWDRTPLFCACMNGHVDVATLLLDRGAEVDRMSPGYMEGYMTPLQVACENGHAAVARVLIDRGAVVDETHRCNETALWLASAKGHVAAARLRLERGADINRSGHRNPSPCDIAWQCGHAAMSDWMTRIRAAGGWTRYLSEPRLPW